jgi:hypothetical protein
MSVFVNVLEEIVVREVYSQIAGLRPDLQPKIKVSEVTAYSLNRLPPLFSTSVSGWRYQYEYALNELKPQISQLVKRGNQLALYGDPLHDETPLPKHLFENTAGVLYELGQILDKKHLRWRDVPNLIKEMSHNNSNYSGCPTIIQDDETQIQTVSHLSSKQKSLLAASKRFISKQSEQKVQDSSFANSLRGANSWSEEKKVRDAAEMEFHALKSYTLQAEFGIVNVWEHLVFLAMEKSTTPAVYRQLNHGETAAYILNRLPAMYATSVRGFKYLRQKAISNFSRELIGETRNGILKVAKHSRLEAAKIPAYSFIQEYEQSIHTIRDFLGRNDICLYNIVEIVRELMPCSVLSA